MIDNSAKTAISRCRLSAPAEYLLDEGLLIGRILDYGCGKGDLKKFLDGDIVQWDPYYYPKKPRGRFDTVVCIYVLNALSAHRRRNVLKHAKEYVKPGGCLYIAVRRDLEIEGRRRNGTEQHNIQLKLPSIARRSGGFEIYCWINK